MLPFDNPRLIADIGSTYARFALETAPGVFSAQTSLRCAAPTMPASARLCEPTSTPCRPDKTWSTLPWPSPIRPRATGCA